MSLTLITALAMVAAPADPVSKARESFNVCLRTFTNENLDAKTPAPDYTKAVQTACTTERQGFVDTMVKAEMQYGDSAGDAKEYAGEEAQMVVDSFVESYGDYLSNNSRIG